MPITVSDYVAVADRVAQLGIAHPVGLAILPDNFDMAASAIELRQISAASTVKSLFRQNDISLHADCVSSAKHMHNNSIDWVGPLLFVGAGLLSENPSIVSVALGVLTNYLTDLFKGRSGERNIRLAVVVEISANRSCRKVEYEGDLSGLALLADIIQKVSDGTRDGADCQQPQ